MTLEIALVLAILVISLYLFFTEKLPMDLVALMVLATLALTGLVEIRDSLAGFSNPAVVTVWAMFILSDGLTRTGIADILGRQILKLAGRSEPQIIIVIMFTGGGLSAVMNNIGVAALLLPVVIDIAAKTNRPPSRLLMPLAYGSLLGGLTTLIGTPPNLLISNALTDAGLRSFGLFDYTPVGLAVMVAGIAFVAFLGRHILPEHKPAQAQAAKSGSLLEQYAIPQRLMVMRVPDDSILDGKTLREIRFGSVLELSVLAIKRHGEIHSGPGPDQPLHAGDLVLAQGKTDRYNEMHRWHRLFTHTGQADLSKLRSDVVGLVQIQVAPHSDYINKTLLEINLRLEYSMNVLAVRREDRIFRSRLSGIVLSPGDYLLVQGRTKDLEALGKSNNFVNLHQVETSELYEVWRLHERMFTVEIPADSPLNGKTLAQSRLGDAFGFTVMGLIHHRHVRLMLGPETQIDAGDTLLIQGWRAYQDILAGLHELDLVEDQEFGQKALETNNYGLAEAILGPRSSLAGRTPREINFFERYGLQVMAVWREGQLHRSNLRNLPFKFGDAFLLYGQRRKLTMLEQDADIMLITPGITGPKRTDKALWAALIMAAVMLPVLFGWLPIAISAIAGVTLMVLTGCINMNQAYHAIEWRAIFLIAGMLPLGQAMETTGAAAMIAEGVMSLLGGLGPWPVLIGLYLITALATTIIPTAALVVMMSPIVLKSCADLGISPHTGMMAIAMAASASFTSPISHPANILVMGPGGYSFKDYLKMGIPLALVVLVTVFLVLPIFWPLEPVSP